MKTVASPFQFRYYRPALATGLTVITISFLTRLALLIKSAAGVDWTVTNVLGLFFAGLVYDLVIAGYFMLPFVLHLWWMNDMMYQRKWRWLVTGIFVAIIAVLVFSSLLPADFNRDLRNAVIGFFVVRFLIYLFMYSRKYPLRRDWRQTVLAIDYFVICYILIFIAISEWFFWDEFSTRFNFIAVDYLVYTNEVLGNIRESYPLGWIIAGVFLVTAAATWLLRKNFGYPPANRPSFYRRTATALVFICLSILGFFLVPARLKLIGTNEYVNELAGNGIFEFGKAFRTNNLEFYKFYRTLPDSTAFRIVRRQLEQPYSRYTSADLFNLEREVSYPQPEQHLNVVLISVESLSADFMQSFGNTSQITPNLDSLARESLFFTNLYASGTRTVRGLEALSLAIAPTPGQSIVKRPGNENLFSLGSVFRSKNYEVEYIYGGYGYFDNMNYFFSNNGYRVVDRTAIDPSRIHYANIWGVADEDLFTLALNELDQDVKSGHNFFAHVMTVSNHRPFTYPEGRIDIPPARQQREGAVKYTDYAIGKFLREARTKPWFDNTVFVIVADHCAGSAGSVQLPVTGYHIPLIIYSPAHITPRRVDRLCAQIDIPPTILGLLHFNYRTKFFGEDALAAAPGSERAFISTYQGLGYLRNDQLIIQSPVRKVQQWQPDFITGKATRTTTNDSLANEAIAFYQCASWLIDHGKYTR